MNDCLIIGSGFSALVAYIFLKKYNPRIISANINTIKSINLLNRPNLNTNKYFAATANSVGNFQYKISSKINLHDRISFGGNSNIWGGFINIEKIPESVIKIFIDNGILFTKLDLKKNGYKTNNENIRQLRNKNGQIINTTNFINNVMNGFVNKLSFDNNYIFVNYFDLKINKYKSEKFKIVFLALSFPQTIDLLFRSNIINKNLKLGLFEYDHKFIKTMSNRLDRYPKNKHCVIKYDFVRSLKHFFGYNKNLDKLRIQLPFYVDQVFSNTIRKIDLSLNSKQKVITNLQKIKFGDSIHYCNLSVNGTNINNYLEKFSKNLIGISSPFVKQEYPGPISNDIILNFINKNL